MPRTREFEIPNSMQSREHSRDGGLGGVWYVIGSVWQNPNGDRNVAVLNYDDNRRKLNLNWFDNDWNDKYRFLAVRNSLYVFIPPSPAGFL